MITHLVIEQQWFSASRIYEIDQHTVSRGQVEGRGKQDDNASLPRIPISFWPLFKDTNK
jgi:hypothetical protein